MYESFMVLAPLPTADVNQPKPFDSVATGSFWKSSSPGTAPNWERLAGDEEDEVVVGNPPPKPVYFPPWLGGRLSERVALSVPIFAKNASFLSFFATGSDPNPSIAPAPPAAPAAGDSPVVNGELEPELVIDAATPCGSVFF